MRTKPFVHHPETSLCQVVRVAPEELSGGHATGSLAGLPITWTSAEPTASSHDLPGRRPVMSTSTIVNNTFTAVYDGLRARPVSHVAATVFLGTSIYVAHAGLQALLPGTLGNALTGLFVALAVLQWLALGRK